MPLSISIFDKNQTHFSLFVAILYFVFCILYFVNERSSTLTSSYYPILVVRAGISILTAISAQKPDDDDVDGDFDDDVDDDDVDVDDDADDDIIKQHLDHEPVNNDNSDGYTGWK